MKYIGRITKRPIWRKALMSDKRKILRQSLLPCFKVSTSTKYARDTDAPKQEIRPKPKLLKSDLTSTESSAVSQSSIIPTMHNNHIKIPPVFDDYWLWGVFYRICIIHFWIRKASVSGRRLSKFPSRSFPFSKFASLILSSPLSILKISFHFVIIPSYILHSCIPCFEGCSDISSICK